MSEPTLTAKQQAIVDMWERHMAAEFERHSIEGTMETMSSDPFVNHVPVMTGGVGERGLIDPEPLPVSGSAAGRKVLDPRAEPSNQLISRATGRG